MPDPDKHSISLLDCTLRDGGYYTNWDFADDLVEEYLASMNSLPIDFLEIGYRSKVKSEYYGAFYYLPEFLLKKIKRITNKKLVVILNEKELEPEDIDGLLRPCMGIVSVIRLAVAPENLQRALKLAPRIKKMGFEVSFNLMYASKWDEGFPSKQDIQDLQKSVDYLYVVDSYGGMYPKQVIEVISRLKKSAGLKIGFHGHNNLEMALANSLAAIEGGADIIDATVCGMGRGAGNLKTELMLTVLHQQMHLPVNFDALNSISNRFQQLKEKYKWGGNLAYMASGAFSLPQKTVFSQLKKRYFSLNSIISVVSNSSEKIHQNNSEMPVFEGTENVQQVLLIGGGPSAKKHKEVLRIFLKEHPEIVLIHSSSKNMNVFEGLENLQIHCLPGMEGKRFENSFQKEKEMKPLMIFPPERFSLSEYVPKDHRERSYRLQDLSFLPNGEVSATAMAFEIALQLSANEVLITGYDGYEESVTREELELYEENEAIFNLVSKEGLRIFSVTPTKYHLASKSIFALS